jgi:P4 family phage/plasmid primase-like protien
MSRRSNHVLQSDYIAEDIDLVSRRIERQLRILLEPVAELRIPGTPRGTVSGYFNKIKQLSRSAASWNGDAAGVYVTLNPVKHALLARSANHLTEYAKQTTTDSDIMKRRWLPIDLDPVRPPGISSSDQEHTWALERAEIIKNYLRDLGWPDPLLADSGNGAHVLYRIDLPNDETSTKLVQRCLEALELRFSDDRVCVDQTTFNAARIWKVYGTLAAKGDSIPERPHRIARLFKIPDTIAVVDRAILEQLADSIPESSTSQEVGGFDLSLWIKNHDLHVAYTGPWKKGKKWVLNPCPWNPEHTNGAAFIVQLENGAISAGCHHNGCNGKDWHALRDHVEPGWRDQYLNRGTSPAQENGEDDDADEEHFTDVRNAQRLVTRHGQGLRYCSAWGIWLVWDGTRWIKDETNEVERRAKETSKLLYQEAAQEPNRQLRESLAKNALGLESRSRLAAMIELAKSEAGIACTSNQLDADPWALNVLNGTLDLRTGELRSHRREDFNAKRAPVKYDETATCPTWDAFLTRIMKGDNDLIRFLQKAVGYCLTGDTSEQVFFILYGTGANGKSTLVSTVMALLGEYAKQTATETLLVKAGNSISNDVARLHGARFVAAVEAEHGRRLAEALVKQFTGGDIVTARFLYHETFEFRVLFKVFLAVNHKPTIRGTDYAIWRRIRLIPFMETIAPAEQDKRLAEKLRGELPGILRWAVKGCLLWQQEGLGEPKAVKVATDGYRKEMDVLATFLTECTRPREKAFVSTKDLYAEYTKWRFDSGERAALPLREFHTTLVERGFTPWRKASERGWRDIELVTDDGE